VTGCSDFVMPSTKEVPNMISVRTWDLPGPLGFKIEVVPRGRHSRSLAPPLAHAAEWTSKYGYLNVAIKVAEGGLSVTDALNEKGLSCGMLALIGTEYPTCKTGDRDCVANDDFCKWAIENFATAEEVEAGVRNVTVWGPGSALGLHYAVRDESGESAVFEFIKGEARVYPDHNDEGVTGFGIMTNEPEFPWQVENVRHFKWKQSLAHPAVRIPGDFYPDERFQRIQVLRSTLPEPKSLQEKISYAAHVLNSVTVPRGIGRLIGTDTTKASSALDMGDHTQYEVIRDHTTKTYYWRSQENPSLQRLVLTDFDLSPNKSVLSLDLYSGPWFEDAKPRLS